MNQDIKLRTKSNLLLSEFNKFFRCCKLENLEIDLQVTIKEAISFQSEELLFEGYCHRVEELWRSWLQTLLERHPFIKYFFVDIDLLDNYNLEDFGEIDCILEVEELRFVETKIEDLRLIAQGIIAVSDFFGNQFYSNKQIGEIVRFNSRRFNIIEQFFENISRYLEETF